MSGDGVRVRARVHVLVNAGVACVRVSGYRRRFPKFSAELRHTRFADSSPGSRLRGARGVYYPRGPFAADFQHLSLQQVQEKQWGQKDKLSRVREGIGWQF